jgi:hypothetical protein
MSKLRQLEDSKIEMFKVLLSLAALGFVRSALVPSRIAGSHLANLKFDEELKVGGCGSYASSFSIGQREILTLPKASAGRWIVRTGHLH